jgi:hypothetical protein
MKALRIFAIHLMAAAALSELDIANLRASCAGASFTRSFGLLIQKNRADWLY